MSTYGNTDSGMKNNTMETTSAHPWIVLIIFWHSIKFKNKPLVDTKNNPKDHYLLPFTDPVHVFFQPVAIVNMLRRLKYSKASCKLTV